MVRRKDVPIRRKATRIWFGEGAEQWSVEDPFYPAFEKQCRELTERKLYHVRGFVSTLLYLVLGCPSTKLAQEKLALLRRAVRDVPSPYEEGSDGLDLS